jgi:hypothetical protein
LLGQRNEGGGWIAETVIVVSKGTMQIRDGGVAPR